MLLNLFVRAAIVCVVLGCFGHPAGAAYKNESSVGVVATSGNAQTSSITLKQKSEFDWNTYAITAFGDFLTASNQGVETAFSWDLGIRATKDLSPRFGIVLGERIDSNKFQNILQRYSTDLGGKYSIVQNEAWIWFTEAGYRFARENYPYGFRNFNFLRLYSEAVRQFSKTVSAKGWVEYLPNLTLWQAYQVNTELSVTAMLNEMFSLKSAYLLRYYNTPPVGTRFNTDTAFTTAIVASF
jgi:hypothetical protein